MTTTTAKKSAKKFRPGYQCTIRTGDGTLVHTPNAIDSRDTRAMTIEAAFTAAEIWIGDRRREWMREGKEPNAYPFRATVVAALCKCCDRPLDVEIPEGI